MLLTSHRQRDAISSGRLRVWQDPFGVSTAGLFIAHWWRETRMNIHWHDPDLYFLLALLAGIRAFVAIIDELRWRKTGWWKGARLNRLSTQAHAR